MLLVASTGACELERSTANSSLEHGAILSHQPRRSFLSLLAVASRQRSTGRDQDAQHTTRLRQTEIRLRWYGITELLWQA